MVTELRRGPKESDKAFADSVVGRSFKQCSRGLAESLRGRTPAGLESHAGPLGTGRYPKDNQFASVAVQMDLHAAVNRGPASYDARFELPRGGPGTVGGQGSRRGGGEEHGKMMELKSVICCQDQHRGIGREPNRRHGDLERHGWRHSFHGIALKSTDDGHG